MPRDRSAAVIQHPRAVELVARRQLRRKVEAAVDRLLAVLDDLDGDPEVEPWLGAPEMADRCQTFELVPGGGYRAILLTWARGTTDNREQDAGNEPELEDEGDPLDLGERDEAEGLV